MKMHSMSRAFARAAVRLGNKHAQYEENVLREVHRLRTSLVLDNCACSAAMYFFQFITQTFDFVDTKTAVAAAFCMGAKFTTDGFWAEDCVLHGKSDATMCDIKEIERVVVDSKEFCLAASCHLAFRNALLQVCLDDELCLPTDLEFAVNNIGNHEWEDLTVAIALQDGAGEATAFRGAILSALPSSRVRTFGCPEATLLHVAERRIMQERVDLLVLDGRRCLVGDASTNAQRVHAEFACPEAVFLNRPLIVVLSSVRDADFFADCGWFDLVVTREITASDISCLLQACLP